MPDPTGAAALGAAVTTSTAAAAAAAPALYLFGVSTGLRQDMLVAGFAGALVAMVLLNSVPKSGDTVRALLEDTGKRAFTALASAIAAGYIGPVVALMDRLPESLLLLATFGVGAGAQRILRAYIDRIEARVRGGAAPEPVNQGGPSA